MGAAFELAQNRPDLSVLIVDQENFFHRWNAQRLQNELHLSHRISREYWSRSKQTTIWKKSPRSSSPRFSEEQYRDLPEAAIGLAADCWRSVSRIWVPMADLS